MKKTLLPILFLLLLLSSLVTVVPSALATNRYLNADATGSNNGTSMANGYTNPTTAINALNGGDTLFIHGVFKLTSGLPQPSSGSDAAHNTALVAVDASGIPSRGGATFSGADTVTSGWTYTGANNVWYRADATGTTGGVYVVGDGILFVPNSPSPIPPNSNPAAGEFGKSGGNIYVRLTDNSDPNSRTIVLSQEFTLFGWDENESDNYITWDGLTIEHLGGIFSWYQPTSPSGYPVGITIKHCDMKAVSQWVSGSNTSFIRVMDNGTGTYKDTTYNPHNWLIRGNTFEDCTEGNWAGHGSMICFYDMTDCRIDSNIFRGRTTGAGIELKGQYIYPNNEPTAVRVVIAFNIFDIEDFRGGQGDGAVFPWSGQHDCIMHGNIFHVGSGVGVSLGGDGQGCPGGVLYPSANKIYNNTFIGCSATADPRDFDAPYCGWNNEIKYNIFYNVATPITLTAEDRMNQYCSPMPGTDGTSNSDGDQHWIIDENQYYRTSGSVGFTIEGVTSGATLSSWQSYEGWDDNSTEGNNPSFANASSYTFSGMAPSNADAITGWSKDGFDFVQAGAVQPTGPPTYSGIRYVRVDGNDADSGTSWESAWQTINKVNASVASGDSVVFGAGVWNDEPLVPVSGTVADPTYYACSSLTVPPILSGADSLSGWTPAGGGVYTTSASVGTDDGLWQGDTLLWRQTTNSLSEGEWYYSGGVIYAYLNGGGDPDNSSVWLTDRPAVNFETNASEIRHVKLYGLHCRYGNRSVVEIGNGNYRPDSIEVRDCIIENGSSWGGINPGCFYFGNSDVDSSWGWRIVHNTIGASVAYYDDTASTDWHAHSNSAGMMIEGLFESTIDSNNFVNLGYQGGIYIKNTQPAVGGKTDNLLIAFNTFGDWLAQSDVGAEGNGMVVYGAPTNTYIIGNTFLGTTGAEAGNLKLSCYDDTYHCNGANNYCDPGPVHIYFNTFAGSGSIMAYVYGLPPDYTSGGCEAGFSYFNAMYNIFAPQSGSAGLIVPYDTLLTGAPTPAPTRSVINYNQYYSSSGYSFSISADGGSETWTEWQAESYDTSSVQQNPSFADAGNGDVTPSNAVSKDSTLSESWWPYSIVTTNYGSVQVPASGPTADFSGTPTTGKVPLPVAFTDASTGSVISWNWNFGDGGTATSQNPSHTYTAAGSYNVTLIVSDGSAADTLTRSNYVTASASTPLTIADNNRYVALSGSPDSVRLLTGAHTWLNLMDFSLTTNPPPTNDIASYLTAVTSYQSGWNYLEFWVWEQVMDDNEVGRSQHDYYGPSIYARSATPGANDGGNKFDLDEWNPDFFGRVHTYVGLAFAAGAEVVGIRATNAWSTETKGGGSYAGYTGHPYNNDNNINGEEASSDNNCSECHSDTTIAAYGRYIAYLKHLYDVLAPDYDNIVIHLCNESVASGLVWQYKVIDSLQTYMASQGKVYPVLLSTPYPFDGGPQDSLLVHGSHELTSCNADGFGSLGSPTVRTGSATGKVWMADTDHIGGLAGTDYWVWRAIAAGHNPQWMDVWDDAYNIAFGFGADSVDIRSSLGWAAHNVNRMPMGRVAPSPTLSSSDMCLADTVNYDYYLVPTFSGSFTLDMSNTTLGTDTIMVVDWYDFQTETMYSKRDTLSSFTSSESLSAPATDAVALIYVEDVSDVTPPGGSEIKFQVFKAGKVR